MNTTFYLISLLVSIVFCIVLGTYFSYKASQYESGGDPPDMLKTVNDMNKRKQSKSNRNLSQGHTVAFTFKVIGISFALSSFTLKFTV
mgnify:CR=1 FL=1